MASTVWQFQFKKKGGPYMYVVLRTSNATGASHEDFLMRMRMRKPLTGAYHEDFLMRMRMRKPLW